jgi:hypothetical protein
MHTIHGDNVVYFQFSSISEIQGYGFIKKFQKILACLDLACHSVFSKWSHCELHSNTSTAAMVYFTQCFQTC